VPLDGADGPLVDPVAADAGPEQAAVAREERAAVRRALARLPEPFRTTLVLREMEGLSYEDIAEALDVSIGTVESRIFRARCKLRVLLEEELP